MIKDKNGYNCIHIAAQAGQTYLLLYYISLNDKFMESRDDTGRTPLLWICYRGHIDTCLSLLKEGADSNSKDSHEISCLHWAISQGHHKICKTLIEFGADINVVDSKGKRPRDWAKEKGQNWWFENHENKRNTRTIKYIWNYILPHLGYPFVLYLMAYVKPWYLSLGLLLIAIFFLSYSFKKLFPNITPQETSIYYNLHLAFLIWGFILSWRLFATAQPQRTIYVLINSILGIIATVLLRKARISDPGRLKNCISSFESRQTIIRLAELSLLNVRNYCISCRIRKPLRSKHCKICDICVAKFDHHCPWTNNCVGANNHRLFFIYLFFSLLAVGMYIMETLKCKITCFIL